MYFDSHCHLDFDTFADNRLELWASANEQGLLGLLIPGVGPEQWGSLQGICDDLNAATRHSLEGPGVHYAVGLHPWWIRDEFDIDTVMTQLRRACEGAVAIGETGLDQTRHADHVALDRQRTFFEAHIELANDLGLPLILHCVQAYEAMLEVLQERPVKSGGVVHSFSGSAEVAKQYLDLDLYLSFSCSVLRFGKKKQAAIARVPDDRLLIETDAPDQSADKERSGNPLDLIEVAKTVAEARDSDVDTIARLTSANAHALFRL